MYKRVRFALCGTILACFAAAADDNPAQRRGPNDILRLAGYWNFANLENRSNCGSPVNDGQHGTYAQYFVSFDAAAATMGITENAVTGLVCTYVGPYAGDLLAPTWTGTFDCSDGKRGTFSSKGFLITPNAMSIRLQMKATPPLACDIDSILGGSRF